MALTYNPKAGISGTTSGMQTVSQQKARMFADLDPKQLTPFQRNQIGSREEIEKEKELARQLIESEKVSPDAKLTIKDQPIKESPKPISKPAEARSKANLWRVMLEGGDPSKDEFYDTKEAADAALKKMGGKGAVAGIRFPAKSREEASTLKEQYMQQSRIGEKTAMLPKSDETEKDRIMRQVVEVNPKATKAQQENYYNTLTASRAKSAEREAASKDRYSKFRSDIAAKRAGEEQFNQYNQQLSALKRAYREARRSGDYVEQYRIGDFINSYTAGVPKEMGARQKASQRGMIATKNRELEEMFRREREARIAAERTSKANPDYYQFSPQPTYRPTYYPEQFANNLTFSNL
jgi:hypothetical protein